MSISNPPSPFADKLKDFNEQKFGLTPDEKRRSSALQSDWNEEEGQPKEENMNQADSASESAENRRALLAGQTGQAVTGQPELSARERLLESIRQKNAGNISMPNARQTGDVASIASVPENLPSSSTEIAEYKEPEAAIVEEAPPEAFFHSYFDVEQPVSLFAMLDQPVSEDIIDEIIEDVRTTGDLNSAAGVVDDLAERFEYDPTHTAFRAGLRQVVLAVCAGVGFTVGNPGKN